MARVFKTSYKDRKGKKRESSRWYIEFRCQHGLPKRCPAFTSKAASEELGRNIEKLVGYFKGSGGQTDPALAGWLAGLPADVHAYLIRIGLIPSERAAAKKTLNEHLDDYAQAMRAKGTTAKQVFQVTTRTRRVFDACGFRHHTDLKASRIMAYLHDLRADRLDDDGEIVKRGISAQTFNFYVGAVKQFCQWMIRDRRAMDNPAIHLDKLNTKTDRRHDRRSLSADELIRLLDATETGPTFRALPGSDRAMLYRVAAGSGLRRSELASLTPESFDLKADPPTITVRAAYSKHRRDDVQPIPAALADELHEYLEGKPTGRPVWNIPDRTADMIRADLRTARARWIRETPDRKERRERRQSFFLATVDDAGRHADFHALRHSFVSALAMGGVNPKTAQILARHSTIGLTLDRYTHLGRGDAAKGLSALPDLTPTKPESEAQELRKTGTDDKNCLASCLALLGEFQCISVDDNRQNPKEAIASLASEKPNKNGVNVNKNKGLKGTHRAGLEPATFGSVDRCSESVNNDNSTTYENSDKCLASCLALLSENPELTQIVMAWPDLPERVRAGIALLAGVG